MSRATKEERKANKAQGIALQQFAGKMLAKLELRGKRLSETVNPGMPRGTLLGQEKDHDIWWYFRRLKGEINELQQAMKRHDINSNEKTRDAVISECCDVANFSAAIAEKAVEDTR